MKILRPFNTKQEQRPRKRGINILRAIDDPKLFGRHFRNRESWTTWRAFLATLFGLPLDEEQLKFFRECTGREHPPEQTSHEAWLVIGRRGGKSFVLATIAVYLACFKEWKQYLGPGERGTIMIVAADRKQARVCLRYIKGLLTSTPLLAELIQNETHERVDLNNRVTIEVHSASFKSTRGYSIIAALCDEIAFWPTSEFSAEPDREVLNALRPGMSNIPGSMLLCASSPYARRGALWDAYRRYFGKPDAPLVWVAPTRIMNPRIPDRIINEAMERDPASAQAEYFAQFRSDVESYISREAVEACISKDVRERPPISGVIYSAFCDPSGGSADSMTLAISHHSSGIAVLDALREVRPPFSPEQIVADFATLLKSYKITSVTGDRYAGEWPREQFRKHGITYIVSDKTKSDLYRDLLPIINSIQVDVLDHPKLIQQLCSLERRTARGGKDSIDHPPGSHDDIANAFAGAVNRTAARHYDPLMRWVSGPTGDAEAEARERREWQRRRLAVHLTGGRCDLF